MAIHQRVTYGQLRKVLEKMGFHEIRRDNGVAIKHNELDIVFLFRSYEPNDRLQPAELFLVTQELDSRRLLESESFEALLIRTPA